MSRGREGVAIGAGFATRTSANALFGPVAYALVNSPNSVRAVCLHTSVKVASNRVLAALVRC